jgi:hypothetical protein
MLTTRPIQLKAFVILCSRPVWKLNKQTNKQTNWLTELTPWRHNPRFHHCIHKSPPPVPILSQLNPLYTPAASLLKIHSDPIVPSTTWSSKWSLFFWLFHQNLVHFPLLSHAYHISRPSHSPWFDLPNNIWGWVQNMKLLIVWKVNIEI